MTDYTRVTIQGESLKADLVLPDDEPVAALLPDVLGLVGDAQQRSARPVVLVTTVGEQLDGSLTLAEQGVDHGSILRIVRIDEAPPPPEVADVTEIVADAGAVRSDAWRPVWGIVAAAAAAVLLGFLATTWWSVLSVPAPSVLALAAAAVVLMGVVTARRLSAGPAVVIAALAVGACFVLASDVAARLAGGLPAATALVAFALVCLVAGVVSVAGFRDPSLGVGGATGVVLVAAWVGFGHAGLTVSHAAALLASVGTLAIGLLPGIAMTLSGLSGLDDRVFDREPVDRHDAARTVVDMFRALTWAVVAAALPVGAALWIVALDDNVWGQWLTVALSLILLLRARVMPLVPQRLALLAAGGTGLVILLVQISTDQTGWALTIAVGVVLALAVAVGSRPSEHSKARLRRWGNILELLSVVAVVPLLLAMLGVFADLVEAF
ncbi:type VII secretion integral membrane protein EccD [Georgenia alba]|uniref:Type VII secretion integral membrane protein EccD n=1 Tax=Georgenia alba TaxID=2233858 RepID=A0ABW2Q7Q1_9MICO